MESNHVIALEIITPDQTAYEGNVSFLVARAIDGEIGILPKHAPLVAALDTAPVKIVKDGKEEFIAVFEGFMEVTPEKIRILTSQCELAENIDIGRAKLAKARAEKRLANRTKDIDVARAEAALRRALMRLRVTKSI